MTPPPGRASHQHGNMDEEAQAIGASHDGEENIWVQGHLVATGWNCCSKDPGGYMVDGQRACNG